MMCSEAHDKPILYMDYNPGGGLFINAINVDMKIITCQGLPGFFICSKMNWTSVTTILLPQIVQ